MNASSESGLWATWMVRGMGPRREGGAVRWRGVPVRLRSSVLRRLPELVDHRLVLAVLDAARRASRRRSAPGSPAAARLPARCRPGSRRPCRGRRSRTGGPGSAARMVSASASGAGQVADLQPEHRRVVAGVGVDRVELGVGAERHRREAVDLRGVALLGGLHDPVEQPVEPLARGHLADVRRRPRPAAETGGPAPGALRARVGHVGRRRRAGALADHLEHDARRAAARRAPRPRARRSARAAAGRGGRLAASAGRPHRWQNRAWGDSSARQPAQVRGHEAGAAGAAEVAGGGAAAGGAEEVGAVIAAEA